MLKKNKKAKPSRQTQLHKNETKLNKHTLTLHNHINDPLQIILEILNIFRNGRKINFRL